MDKLHFWNFLGEIFELDEAWVKCLELESQAARLLARLDEGPVALAKTAPADIGLSAEIRRFLGSLSQELRSVTPRPPALAVDRRPSAAERPLKGRGKRPSRRAPGPEDSVVLALETLDSLLAGPLSGGLAAGEFAACFPLIRAALRQVRTDLALAAEPQWANRPGDSQS